MFADRPTLTLKICVAGVRLFIQLRSRSIRGGTDDAERSILDGRRGVEQFFCAWQTIIVYGHVDRRAPIVELDGPAGCRIVARPDNLDRTGMTAIRVEVVDEADVVGNHM